jgi:signal transduction histidine kinase
MRGVAEPARGLVTEIHLALAMQGDALQDFLRSGDPAFLARYRQMADRERATYQRLGLLTTRLGAEVRQRFDTLLTVAMRWHAVADAALIDTAGSTVSRTPGRRAPARTELYEDVLVAAAQLDDALSRAAQIRRRQILAAERLEVRLTSLLVAIALAAVVMVALVGRQLRLVAAETERRRREIERLMEGKARLMRGLAHDLKNPLNAIYGYAQLLEDGVLGELARTQRESVAHIRRAVRGLLELIHDLTQLWRAEVGDLPVTLQLVDIGPIVRDTAESYRGIAEGAGHHLEVAIEEELPAVWTDVRRVRQILGNLVTNAVKYTPHGGHILVAVRERSTDVESRELHWNTIEVEDSGPGIAPDKLDVIFEEFTRLEPSVASGAGLGLAISRRVARLLGGDVTVRSEVGHGSTFALWLPAAASTRSPLSTNSGSPLPSEISAHSATGTRLNPLAMSRTANVIS